MGPARTGTALPKRSSSRRPGLVFAVFREEDESDAQDGRAPITDFVQRWGSDAIDVPPSTRAYLMDENLARASIARVFEAARGKLDAARASNARATMMEQACGGYSSRRNALAALAEVGIDIDAR